MEEKKLFLKEIRRVLKKNGICYLSAPNKLYFLEPHYRLPFISWMPRQIANFIVKSAKMGPQFDIEAMTYFGYKNIFKKHKFYVKDFSLEIMKNPKKYLQKSGLVLKIISCTPKVCLKFLNFFGPTYVFILRK